MSFLAPLYLLGGLAISLPVLLHLIRRTPRGHQPFSSLMFLTPSPPRITRRSRIEHWLLLALRALALALLAFAFARPFLRSSASLLTSQAPGRQVAILLDKSASMRRGNVFEQAVQRAERLVQSLAPQDTVALFSFDSELHKVIDFPEATVDSRAHQALLMQSLDELSPSWKAGRLDHALISVADALAASRRDRGSDHPGQIVVISDMQQGSELAGLQGYEWPREVTLTLEKVAPESSGNAAARLLRNVAEGDLRARVTNTSDSKVEEFQVGWSGPDGKLVAATSIYVPAGQTRVVKLTERPVETDRLKVVGDAETFDNDYFVGPEIQQQVNVVYLGDDRLDDPRGLRYFLERVWTETPRRKVTIRDVASTESLKILPGQIPDLVLVSAAGELHGTELRTYLESGGCLLIVATDEAIQPLLSFLPGIAQGAAATPPSPPSPASTAVNSKSATSGQQSPAFALLSDIDFSHPVFAAFADPRFGDFTKVRFWRHQQFQIQADAKARIFAKFDDGSPALWEQPVGSGRVFVFATTWRPADSQLALSSKFVPLLSSVLNQATEKGNASVANLLVGDPLIINEKDRTAASVVAPGGTETKASPADGKYAGTEQPGMYQIKSSQNSQAVAVNLAASESDTTPLGNERFEQLGVRVGSLPTKVELAEGERQMRDIELESRQKLWQWLMVAAIAVLGIESTVAARATRKEEQTGKVEEPSTV